MKLGKKLAGLNKKLGKNFYPELAPLAIVSVLIGGATAKVFYGTEHAKMKAIIAEQRESISALKVDVTNCVEKKAQIKEPAPDKQETRSIKEPVKCPDAKNCTDDRANRYAAEMASCTEYLKAALHMGAPDAISCDTARRVHGSIAQGMKHCERATEEAKTSKEKSKAKLKTRQFIAVRGEKKNSPPPCNISIKR